MSPSEFDLRAALRDGEGDQLDVENVLFAARARVAERRMRILSGAALVLVVAGAGVGGTYLAQGGGSSRHTAERAAGGGSSLDQATSGAQAPVNGGLGAAGTASVPGVSCPVTQPRYALPGGGGLGQFGSTGPLFTKPVQSIVVCAYGSTTTDYSTKSVRPVRLDLVGQQARLLANSLEDAPTRPTPTCTQVSNANQLTVIAVAPDGTRAGTVVASVSGPSCGSQVTNGTAVRYGWTPPSRLKTQLLELKPHR
jgi:hypothetical protein